MSTTRPNAPSTNGGQPTAGEKSYFDQQREMLMSEVAISLDHVLHNINKLNRSLEEIIGVGNEFQPVEALWSHFENVMAKDGDVEGGAEGQDEEGEEETAGGKGEGDKA